VLGSGTGWACIGEPVQALDLEGCHHNYTEQETHFGKKV